MNTDLTTPEDRAKWIHGAHPPHVQNQIKRLVATVDKALALLKESTDHHNFCGYGDSYERECANEAKLPERLEDFLIEQGVER